MITNQQKLTFCGEVAIAFANQIGAIVAGINEKEDLLAHYLKLVDNVETDIFDADERRAFKATLLKPCVGFNLVPESDFNLLAFEWLLQIFRQWNVSIEKINRYVFLIYMCGIDFDEAFDFVGELLKEYVRRRIEEEKAHNN